MPKLYDCGQQPIGDRDARDTADRDRKYDEIPRAKPHDPQASSPLAAPVTTAFHSERQIVGTRERADKQGDKYGNERFAALHDPARVQIRAARLLCGHDLIDLVNERRDKAERDGHHHGNGMDVDMHALERGKQPLDGVGQERRRSRIGQQRARRHQSDNANRCKQRHEHAARGKLEFAELPKHRSVRVIENLQNRRDTDQNDDGLQAF